MIRLLTALLCALILVAPISAPPTQSAESKAAAARAKQGERVKALVASASPSLKRTVINLLKEGRRVEAVAYYASETGEDITTAKGVVEQLAAQNR